jgi:hypothetical protein
MKLPATYDDWRLASPPDDEFLGEPEPDPDQPDEPHEEEIPMDTFAITAARRNLYTVLVHWKAGTRRGHDPVTESDVVDAVADLVKAMIDRAERAGDHSR